MGIIIEGLAGTISRMFKTVRKPLVEALITTQGVDDIVKPPGECEDNSSSESKMSACERSLIKEEIK